MDRVLLMGYLEEMHSLRREPISATVISDISEEFQRPDPRASAPANAGRPRAAHAA
jgi:hypothetical protein